MKRHHLIFTLFGATGDLATRKLYPAIYRLYKKKFLSKRFALIGTGRRNWTHDYFRGVILDSIDEEIENLEHAKEFISHCYYQSHDVTQTDQYFALKDLIESLESQYETRGHRLYYISLSPELFPVITRHLKECDLTTQDLQTKLIIEKPFGHDLATATQLQDKLERSFNEEQIYRIDHYLGKGIVNSLLEFRFNNILLSSIWNKDNIRQIQISLVEQVGVEDRAAYYDPSGVSKDMLQNHILQLVALIAMRQPNQPDTQDLRQEKIRILENIHYFENMEEFKRKVIRGQYGADINQLVPSYREEKNVSDESTTETFLAAHLEIDLPEWQGIPFFVRSGKRFAQKKSEIHIEFKSTHNILPNNRLTIEISPKMAFKFHLNYMPFNYQSQSEPIILSTEQVEDYANIPLDYERLILDCMNGNLDNFCHWLEVANAWKFVDSLHAYWQQMPRPDFPNYAAFSYGPIEADCMLTDQGYKWFNRDY